MALCGSVLDLLIYVRGDVLMDLKGGIIEFLGWIFVFMGGLNSATKDGVPGLVRIADFFEKWLGESMFWGWLRWIGNDFGTFFLILLGVLFLAYRGRWLFGMLSKYLPVRK